MDGDEISLFEDDVSHPHIADEMPGVDLASETPGVSQGISREDKAIEIVDPSQEQLVQSAIHNNSLSFAGPDRTPGVPFVNFSNGEDIVDSSQEFGVIPKSEPKVEANIDTNLDSASDEESVEEDDTANEDQFSEESITPPPEQTSSTTNAHGLRRSTGTPRPPKSLK